MISLIIPMFNEESILPDTLSAVCSYIDGESEKYEVVFVDDGSCDNSAEIVRACGHKDVKVISYKPNRGKGGAVRAGMLSANGDYAIFTDCDLAYGLEAVGRFIPRLDNSGADIIIGSRKLHDEGYASYPLLRRIASKGFVWLVRALCGFELSDSQTGIKGFKTTAAREIFSRCETDGWAFDIEALMIAQKLGFNVIEESVTIINHRESKVNVFRDSLKMLFEIFRIKRSVKKKLQ